MNPTLNEEFLKFLGESPELLAQFVEVFQEFLKRQGQLPPSVPQDGPHEWKFDEDHPLTTEGISSEDLAAIAKGVAQANVKEKAIAYVKGFITGIMLVGGGA